ncbi:Polysaccharide biosynthesis protein [Nitrincola lacisaponensis]|uniref:Polysaccharide biosynthesis protein n=1 Tax=Nitrincola lacisaponensis TaxID=267850 RepID=A0A063Y250_9GAMM|nr:polysaccharide biosynthesis C-terminal domain-containing protein [Nitrincola lacisaponensis]KDE39240.1 Polysaccharide biosynthesis protein [Nitrincola lacisaponensis]
MLINFLKKKGSLALICKAISAAGSFVFLWVVAKALEINEAGVFLYTYNLMLIIVQISRAGTEHSMVKELCNVNSKKSERVLVYQTVLYVLLMCSFALFLAYLLMTSNFIKVYAKGDSINTFYVFVLVSVLFTMTQVFASFFQAKQKIIYQYWSLNIGIVLLGSLAGFYLMFSGAETSYEMSYAILVSVMVVLAISLYGFFKSVSLDDNDFLLKSVLKSFSDFVKVTAPYAPVTFLSILTVWGSQLISARWLNAYELAVLAVIMRFAYLVHFAHLSLTVLNTPVIATLHSSGKISYLLDRTIKHNLVIKIFSFLMFMVFLIFGSNLLNMFGSNYVVGHKAMVIMAGAWMIVSFLGPVSSILLMTDNVKYIRHYIIYSITISFVLAFWLIPEYRIDGVVYATTAGIVLQAAMCAVKVFRLYGVCYISPFVFKEQFRITWSMLIKR